MTYAIDLAAYALYAFSGFDLLTRVMPSRPTRVAIAGAYVTVLTGLVYGGCTECPSSRGPQPPCCFFCKGA
jgi:hypothetical protein